MDGGRGRWFDENHVFVRREHAKPLVNLGNRPACGSQTSDASTQPRVATLVTGDRRARLVQVGDEPDVGTDNASELRRDQEEKDRADCERGKTPERTNERMARQSDDHVAPSEPATASRQLPK